jgi:nitrate/nitrite transporter NarK
LRHLIATSTTVRIIHTSLFSFFYYLTIGLLLAVLPGFVHLHLGLSPLWAGVAVGSQYLATLVTRPKAGRMTDVMGPRTTVLIGQLTGLLSGLCLIAAASLQSKTAVGNRRDKVGFVIDRVVVPQVMPFGSRVKKA